VHGDTQRHQDLGKLCSSQAEETPIFFVAPAINCCCRTIVRIVCAESILFGVYAKPRGARCAGIVGSG
jgi:hypothetical protein